ncbi:MAG: PspC domain-containing protein [Flavobacteriales bacterium]|nr:PspC domain-containing protein [Flavobacteriales bacterium]
MNKTIMINLGGTVFHVEEDAFQIIKNYLDRIKDNFTGDPGEKEIMDDIEARIAELFLLRQSETKNVIVRSDVDDVIAIMGQPEDYNLGDTKQEAPASESTMRNRNRRVYRDKDDEMIGGVCAGLSHYFGWDPIILRAITVVLILVGIGTPILVYIILWAVIPVAETTAEKLQMMGEPVTVENIRKKVNEEAKVASENIRKTANKSSRNFSRKGREVASAVGNVISRGIGLIFLFIGLSILISGIGSWIAADINFFGAGKADFNTIDKYFFNNSGDFGWLLAGGILVIVSICIALIYSGIKLLFGVNKKIPGLGWSLTVLIIIGVTMLIWTGVSTLREYSNDADLKTTYTFNSDTIYLSVNDDVFFHNSIEYHDREFFDMIKDDGNMVVFGEPVSLQFYETDRSDFKMEVLLQAHGQTNSKAIAAAEKIVYNYTLQGDTILLDPYFKLPENIPYRDHHVEIQIFIPEGKSIQLGKNINRINHHEDFDGKVKTMGEDGWHDEHHSGVIFRHDGIEITRSEHSDSVHVKVGEIEITNSRN